MKHHHALALFLPLLAVISTAIAVPSQGLTSEHPLARKHDPYFQPIGAKSTSYMPRVIIRNMLQDREGHIWFATFGGPIRYDGKAFTNFGEEVGLPKVRIFSLLEARSGELWFGSMTGGATRYDGKTFTKFMASFISKIHS